VWMSLFEMRHVSIDDQKYIIYHFFPLFSPSSSASIFV
jgi:hypothetical protein